MLFSVKSEGKEIVFPENHTEVFYKPNVEFTAQPSESLDYMAKAFNEISKLSLKVAVSNEGGTTIKFSFHDGFINFYIGKDTKVSKPPQSSAVKENDFHFYLQDPHLKPLMEELAKEDISSCTFARFHSNKQRLAFSIHRKDYSYWFELSTLKIF